MASPGPASDGPASDGPASDGPAPDGRLADDDVHLAALLAVLALTRADAAPHSTPLQQWRARRLAALSAKGATTARPSAAPRPAGHRRWS
jgi:hypothetical protein